MERPISTILFPVFNLIFGCFSLFGLLVGLVTTLQVVRAGDMELLEMPEWWIYVSFGVSLASLVATLMQMAGSVILLRLRERGRVWCIRTSLYFLAMNMLFTPVNSWLGMQQMLDQFQQAESRMAGNEKTFFHVSLIAGMIGGIVISLAYSGLQAYLLTRPRVVAACQGRLAPAAEEAEARWAQQPMPEFAERSAEVAANPFASPLAAPDPMFAPVETVAQPSAIETLIPVRNGQALASYYLGLFSLLPLLGFPLGAVAVYLGLRGLARYREQPAVRGRTHAWVGIVCGGLFGLFNLALVALMVIGIVGAVMSGEM